VQPPDDCPQNEPALWFWRKRLAAAVGSVHAKQAIVGSSTRSKIALIQSLLTLHYKSISRLGRNPQGKLNVQPVTQDESLKFKLATFIIQLRSGLRSLFSQLSAQPWLAAGYLIITISQISVWLKLLRDERLYRRARVVTGRVVERSLEYRVSETGFVVYSPHVRVSYGAKQSTDRLSAFQRNWMPESMTHSEATSVLKLFPKGKVVDVFADESEAFLLRRRNLSDSHWFTLLLFAAKSVLYGELYSFDRVGAWPGSVLTTLARGVQHMLRLIRGRCSNFHSALQFESHPPVYFDDAFDTWTIPLPFRTNRSGCDRSLTPLDRLSLSSALAVDWISTVVAPISYFITNSIRSIGTTAFQFSLIHHVLTPTVLCLTHAAFVLFRAHRGVDWIDNHLDNRRLVMLFAEPLSCSILVPHNYHIPALLSVSALESLSSPQPGRPFILGLSFALHYDRVSDAAAELVRLQTQLFAGVEVAAGAPDAWFDVMSVEDPDIPLELEWRAGCFHVRGRVTLYVPEGFWPPEAKYELRLRVGARVEPITEPEMDADRPMSDWSFSTLAASLRECGPVEQVFYFQ
jgi:hypothetical protein